MKKRDRFYYHYDKTDSMYFWNMVYYTYMINKRNRDVVKEFRDMSPGCFVQMIRAVDTLLCNQRKEIEELKDKIAELEGDNND